MATKKSSKRGTSNFRMRKTIEGIAKGLPVSVAMQEAGYGKGYSHNPQDLVRTESFQRMLDTVISLEDTVAVHRKLLESKREEIQQRAVETSYKIHGVYDRQRSAHSTAPIQIVINPPTQQQTTRIVDGVEVIEREGAEE